MLRKIIYTSLFVLMSSLVHDAGAMEKRIDPDAIKNRPLQTQNGKGVNFNTLGLFEEEFLKDCRGLEICKDLTTPIASMLMLGEAYGRLPMRVLQETPGGLSNIFVNDLSSDNLKHLKGKLDSMKVSEKINEVQSASRMGLIVADCLDLPVNAEFKALISLREPDNYFDLLMCSNVLHFFDGAQVLKFFINTFNFLKPGGKAYLFTQSRTKDFSFEELLRRKSYMCTYTKACFEIMEAAKRNTDILFPGLINDEWLVKKTPALEFILSQKPNGLCTVNYIPETTLQLICTQLGFEIASQKFYSMVGTRDSIAMCEDQNGDQFGLILRKPADHHAGDPVTVESLDPAFVEKCLNATEKMKTFIDTKLSFPEGYPFVQVKE